MLSRAEVSNMRDVGLMLAYDRCTDRLSRDWRAGQPGKLSDVYDIALMRIEADLRGFALRPLGNPGQMSFDLSV